MTVGVEGYDEDILAYTKWALELGLWDGRFVSWLEASEFCTDVHSKISRMLLEEQSSGVFERFAAQLAWIGGNEETRALLVRDIQHIQFGQNGEFQPAGLKSFFKWIAKHKKEVLIGLAVVAVVTVVVVVAVCSGGSAAAGAAAAGTAALDQLAQGDSDPEPTPRSQSFPSSSGATEIPLKQAHELSLPQLPDHSLYNGRALDSLDSRGKIFFEEEGLSFRGQHSSYKDIVQGSHWPSVPDSGTSFSLPLENLISPLPSQTIPNISVPPPPSLSEPPQPCAADPLPLFNEFPSSARDFCPPIQMPEYAAPPPFSPLTEPERPSIPTGKSWIASFFETIGEELMEPEIRNPETPLLPPVEVSRSFTTPGKKEPHIRIGGINGMNTSWEGALSHADYVSKITQGHAVDWVYNHSHGPVLDVFEIFTMNYFGYSPNTAELLRKEWVDFHEANKDNPHAKYLQICHSQGAIHTRNALQGLPEEIRQRVIVVAIAPGAVVPKELCYDSYNYACKTDPIPHGELLIAGAFNTHEYREMTKPMELMMDYHQEIIFLDPLPESSGTNHDFQNPAFAQVISERCKIYIQNAGEYP